MSLFPFSIFLVFHLALFSSAHNISKYGITKHCKSLINNTFYDYSILCGGSLEDSLVDFSSNKSIAFHLCNKTSQFCQENPGYTAYLIESNGFCIPLSPKFSSYDSNYNISQIFDGNDKNPKGIQLEFTSSSLFNGTTNYSLTFQIFCDLKAGAALANARAQQQANAILVWSRSALGCSDYKAKTLSGLVEDVRWVVFTFLIVFGFLLCFFGQKLFPQIMGSFGGLLAGVMFFIYLAESSSANRQPFMTFLLYVVYTLAALCAALIFGLILAFLEKFFVCAAFGILSLLIVTAFQASFLSFLDDNPDSTVGPLL